MNIAELRDKLNALANDIAETEVQQVEAVAEDNIEEGMKTLKCKDCGDMLGNPTTACEHDSMDPKGDNWIMIDADNDGDMDIAVANEDEDEYDDDWSCKDCGYGPIGIEEDDCPECGSTWSSQNEGVEVREEEVTEEEVEETVEVPVAALAELMQLAGYTDYASKLAEYENEPEEEYMDAEDQLVGMSGGLNGPKKMYPAAAGGDNPMDQEPREIEEGTQEIAEVENTLYKSYKAFLEEAEIETKEE